MSQTITETTRRGTRGPAPLETNIRDVASRAGVSPATVSRVFSGSASVSEPTRTRVLEAADELGYVASPPHPLATRRPLAVIAKSIDKPAVAQMISGAEAVARAEDTPLSLAFTGGDGATEQAILQDFHDQRVVGVLLIGSTKPGPESEQKIRDLAEGLNAQGTRLVLAAHPHVETLPDIPTVNYDNADGMRQVVRHLTQIGRRRIAFLGQADTTTAAQRFRGYSEGLRELGYDIDPSLVVECPDEIVPAHLAALLLLNGPYPPDAIVALTDDIAIGVCRAARDIAVNIPYDLAVTGFDDSPYAADLMPSLTTVHVPFRDIGARAAQILLTLDESDDRTLLPVDLIVRGSTASAW
ncbi:MAG: LacI family transcriptional regulator [Propionibacteriaceae bacterium]|jgi:LacI family transcriptional regulator|nr:LacI family transcriptional regulator [Propionibacteriaceae bacterium]